MTVTIGQRTRLAGGRTVIILGSKGHQILMGVKFPNGYIISGKPGESEEISTQCA